MVWSSYNMAAYISPESKLLPCIVVFCLAVNSSTIGQGRKRKVRNKCMLCIHLSECNVVLLKQYDVYLFVQILLPMF